MTVREQVERCRDEVEQSAQHVLSFASRRRMLLSIGPLVLDANGRAAELSAGKRARALLARKAAGHVAHSWRTELRTDALEQLLALIDGYLAGTTERSTVLRRTEALTGGLANAPTPEQRAGWLAGKAAAGAGWVAVSDELLCADEGVTEAELDDPEDPDLFDPAFWAACAFAGGLPGEVTYRPADALAFWRWYLDQITPA